MGGHPHLPSTDRASKPSLQLQAPVGEEGTLLDVMRLACLLIKQRTAKVGCVWRIIHWVPDVSKTESTIKKKKKVGLVWTIILMLLTVQRDGKVIWIRV